MNKFKSILYVLSNTINESSPSLVRAIALAKSSQADLTLLYVLPKPALSSYLKGVGFDNRELEAKALAREEANLHQLIASLGKGIPIKAELRVGKNYIESIRAVQANDFALVIKEADRFSWLDRFIGSDDMNLLRECPCPVWLMHKNEKPDYHSIMAAVDFDTDEGETCNAELNERIVDLASSLSLAGLTSLYVVNAYDVPEVGFIRLWVEQPDEVEKELFESEYRLRQHKMAELFTDMKQRLGEDVYNYLSPRSHIVRGIAGQELPKVAKMTKADLIVMGTVARTGIAGVIIGNTAETVLSQLECSVLAIKPKGFVSPVV